MGMKRKRYVTMFSKKIHAILFVKDDSAKCVWTK